MNECFDNLIAVRGGCTETTLQTGGFFINQIGITLKELNDIISSDYETGEDLLDDKISFAADVIKQDIYTHFSPKFKVNSILEGQRIGYYSDNLTLVNGIAATSLGIQITIGETGFTNSIFNSQNNSSYLDFFVSDIILFTDYTGNVVVNIYDLIQNKLLDTITIAGVANEMVTTTINKVYKSNRKKMDLIFVYDSTGINAISSTVNGSGTCTSCGTTFINCNQFVRASGIKVLTASNKIKSNITGVSNVGGLSINYSLQCNHTDFLCTFANLMALPMLYKVGIELMEYSLLNSDRENSETIIDVEKNKERLKLFYGKFDEAMNNLLKNIKLPNDRHCFECEQRNKTVTMLPN